MISNSNNNLDIFSNIRLYLFNLLKYKLLNYKIGSIIFIYKIKIDIIIYLYTS